MGAEASKPQGIDWDARAEATHKLLAAVEETEAEGFFNRKQELADLLLWLTRKPTTKVVVGPYDSGKTRLLKRLKALWATDEYLTATSPIFHVDLRMLAAFRLLGVKSRTALDLVLKLLTDVNPKPLPIFILDQAEQLRRWPAADVKTLMGYFKSLDERSYLLLSSSDDDFFTGWLPEMFQTGQWSALGVGFFPEEEARQFFTAFCIPQVRGSLPDSFSEADWQGVYKVCGGSPLLLIECASRSHKLAWKDAATSLARDSLSPVENGLYATVEMEGFEGAKYRKLIQAIVKDEWIGVPAVTRKIYDKKSETCKEQIKAMVHGNYIHVRYVTQEIRYADIQLSQDVKEIELVMAPSPAHRVAMEWALNEFDDDEDDQTTRHLGDLLEIM